MQRRDFLKAGLVAGGATMAAGSGAPPSTDRKAAEAGAGAAQEKSLPEFEHAGASVSDLQAAQAAGRLTARALAVSYFLRMDAIDVAGPRLNAVIGGCNRRSIGSLSL